MGYANYGLRFLLELAALTALGYWGFAEHDGALQWLLGLGAPLAVAVAWGLFVSPKASHPTSDPIRLALEVTVFGWGAAALWAADRPAFAVVLAALAVVHLALTFVLGQRPPAPAP
jgi:hypothetical protein